MEIEEKIQRELNIGIRNFPFQITSVSWKKFKRIGKVIIWMKNN